MTEQAPSPFSVNIPNFQVSWDSTSLGWLKTCPKLYEYQMVRGWSSRSKGIHLAFGGWYASGVEHYAHSRASGLSHDEATIAMVKWALEATGDYYDINGQRVIKLPKNHEAYAEVPKGNIPPNCALWLYLDQDNCIQLIVDSDTTFAPWTSDDPFKNRYTLIRSLVWNVEDRLNSNWTTLILANGKPAVELSFNFHAFDLEDEPIFLSGHMDEIVENNGQVWVKDDKTTKGPLDARYFAQYTPHNQMSLYSVAGKVILNRPVAGVLIRAAQIQVGFTRFATQQAPRPPAVLAEWLEDTKTWISLARSYAVAGHWPMNDKSCSDYGGCAFQKVCSVSPSHREAWLKSDFVQRRWNPLAVRGDIA